MEKKYSVSEGITERLDTWLATQLGSTRSQVQKLIRLGQVLINNELPQKTGALVYSGNVISLTEEKKNLPEKKYLEANNSLFSKIEIVAETLDYIIINKPAGLIVHPVATVNTEAGVVATNTLSAWIIKKYPAAASVGESVNRPGMIHRLDKDTSGLMIIALNQTSFLDLKNQFKNRTIIKKYYALVHGTLPTPHSFLNFLVARGKDGRMVARPNITEVTLKNVDSIQDGRVALTEFSVTTEYINYTLCDVTLHTGRTHQIRVHFFAYNHPLVGDPLYFNKKIQKDLDNSLGRVFLHSYFLSFFDLKKEQISLEISLPETLARALTKLKPL